MGESQTSHDSGSAPAAIRQGSSQKPACQKPVLGGVGGAGGNGEEQLNFRMEVFLASPAVTSAATEVLTDVSKILELCDAALAMARERGDMEMAEIIARVRTSLAQKGTRHRSPSTKKHSAKRPRKAQRERKRDVIAPSPAAAEEAMAQAPPTTRGIPVSAAGKRQVVPRTDAASATEAEVEAEEEEETEHMEQRRRKSTAASTATGQAATITKATNDATTGEAPRTPTNTPARRPSGSTAMGKGVMGAVKKSASSPGKGMQKISKTRGEKLVELVAARVQAGLATRVRQAKGE